MNPKSLLIVDDEESIRSFMCDYLTSLGYKIVEAHCGEDALGKFAPGEFDCVISDLCMPGMGGIEMVKLLRNLDADVPILFMTGYSVGCNLTAIFPEERFRCLMKPFLLDDLHLAIDYAIRVKRASPSLPGGE